MEVEWCDAFIYIHLFCKFTLSKIYKKLIQYTEGLMVVTRCNYLYLVCQLIKFSRRSRWL